MDLGNVLLVQDISDSGTLVSGNELVCFNAPVGWSSRNQSLLEYNLASVCIYLAVSVSDEIWSCFCFSVHHKGVLCIKWDQSVHRSASRVEYCVKRFRLRMLAVLSCTLVKAALSLLGIFTFRTCPHR